MKFCIQACIIGCICVTGAISGSCLIGTVVYCPYPGLTAFLQAIVLSDVIESEFTVQWSGSPDLCVHPSNKSQCVVDAAFCYNTAVCICIKFDNFVG